MEENPRKPSEFAEKVTEYINVAAITIVVVFVLSMIGMKRNVEKAVNQHMQDMWEKANKE